MRQATRSELIAVLLTLVILTGIALPVYLTGRRDQAKRNCLRTLDDVSKMCSVYRARNG